MINAMACEAQARLNVPKLQIRQFFNDLFRCQPISKQVQNITDPNSHTTDAWAATTLFRIHSNSLSKFYH